eukprot:1142488-Pelagomonas_calceolata.AAC.4
MTVLLYFAASLYLAVPSAALLCCCSAARLHCCTAGPPAAPALPGTAGCLEHPVKAPDLPLSEACGLPGEGCAPQGACGCGLHPRAPLPWHRYAVGHRRSIPPCWQAFAKAATRTYSLPQA